MRKINIVMGMLLLGWTMVGCNKVEGVESQYKTESLVGYMVIEKDKLYLDEVEIIIGEDQERIKELGLVEENDLPNGYYIHNLEVQNESFQLTNDTIYGFTDDELLFVKDAESNRFYETTNLEEFLEGSSYQEVALEQQKIPYFIEVYDGKVIRVTEEFIYTQ
ncbi:MAG: hypothetical protein E7231_04260 [Cellulosilyticum sp.]|nr:hypothetical protein [Cellulosilyticum sp.]